MYGPLFALSPTEVLICVFFRGDGGTPDRVEATDFQRRMNLTPPEGGLSFWRATTTDYKHIIEKIERNPDLNRGIATITISDALELGFQVCGDIQVNDKHVNLHCEGCDCAKRNCSSSTTCAFIPPILPTFENDRMRRRLANTMSKSVIIEARKKRQDLLDIFGKDVSGSVSEKNVEYAHRFEFEMKKPSTESSAR